MYEARDILRGFSTREIINEIEEADSRLVASTHSKDPINVSEGHRARVEFFKEEYKRRTGSNYHLRRENPYEAV